MMLSPQKNAHTCKIINAFWGSPHISRCGWCRSLKIHLQRVEGSYCVSPSHITLIWMPCSWIYIMSRRFLPKVSGTRSCHLLCVPPSGTPAPSRIMYIPTMCWSPCFHDSSALLQIPPRTSPTKIPVLLQPFESQLYHLVPMRFWINPFILPLYPRFLSYKVGVLAGPPSLGSCEN